MQDYLSSYLSLRMIVTLSKELILMDVRVTVCHVVHLSIPCVSKMWFNLYLTYSELEYTSMIKSRGIVPCPSANPFIVMRHVIMLLFQAQYTWQCRE